MITLLGAAAPFVPYLELINHFRPFVVLGMVAVLALAWIAGSRRARRVSVAVLAVNAGLLLMPLAYASATAPRSSLRITTFNLWVGNERSLPDVIRFVTESQADVVIMQEVDARLERALVPPLRMAYPHAVSCAQRNCGLLILSKREPVASGASDRTPSEPPLVWARFSTEDGRHFTVTGVHVAWPFQPEWQARQIESLIRRFAEAEGTQILVGDFNLTPFSWKLNRLTAATGLRRHATFGATWPAFPLFPVVLLDNLLSTPDVRSAGVAIGSSGYGSDHRPITFDLALD
jgi:endonuclease/exonuclease/phosphatase (EEP) superfamily protein YafD